MVRTSLFDDVRVKSLLVGMVVSTQFGVEVMVGNVVDGIVVVVKVGIAVVDIISCDAVAVTSLVVAFDVVMRDDDVVICVVVVMGIAVVVYCAVVVWGAEVVEVLAVMRWVKVAGRGVNALDGILDVVVY